MTAETMTTTKRPTPRRKKRQGIGLYKSANGRFYLDAWIRGQRIRESFGAIDEKLARDLAVAARAAVLRGVHGIAPTMRKDITFDKAVREFTERHVRTKRPSTQAVYAESLARLTAYFGTKRLSEIGPLTVEGYRKARTQNHTTSRVRCDREVALLRALFGRMSAWGLYEGPNPIRSVGGKSTVGRYAESAGRTRVLTLAEEARLMATLPAPYDMLVRLCLQTGLRMRSEALTLTWEDLDLDRARLTVRAAHAKNGRARVIPLAAGLVTTLTAFRPVGVDPTARVFLSRGGRPLRDVSSILRRTARRAQVRGFSPHVTRHTWATRLMQSGADLKTLQTLGGWQSLAMILQYAHADEIHAAAAVERMTAQFTAPEASAVPGLVPGVSAGARGSARQHATR